MYELVRSWREGAQTKSDFCKTVGINIHTFTYWVQKYQVYEPSNPAGKSPQKFIPLQVKVPRPSTTPGLELIYPNGVRLCMPAQSDLNLVSALIKIAL